MSYIKYNVAVPTLARFTTSLTAQQTLLDTHPEAGVNLAANPALHREVWFRLARKAKADVAYGLVNRPLDLEQLKLFINDKRVTVRRNLVTNGLKACTDEMGEFLLAQPWFDQELATLWSATKTVPETLRRRVALRAGGNELVRHLANRDLFSDDEVKELLPTVVLSNVRVTLYQLMDLRPEIVPFAATSGVSHPRLVEAAAGSRHLFDPETFAAVISTVEHLGRQNHHSGEILLSLMSNPNLPLDLLERLVSQFPSRLLGVGSRYRPAMNQTILQEAHRRLAESAAALQLPWEQYLPLDQGPMRTGVALLGTHRYPTLRPVLLPEAVALSVAAPVRTGAQAAEEADLGYLPAGNSPVRLTGVTVARVTELLDPHGPRAWENFWSLIDAWQGDLASLVDSSVALAG